MRQSPSSRSDSLRSFILSDRRASFLLAPLIRCVRTVHNLRCAVAAASYEYLFRSVEAGSLVLTVPEFNGVFEMNCRSHITKRLLTSKAYEPDLAALVKERLDPAKDAIDVGANVGLFTTLMAASTSTSSRVLAIEPTPVALGYLRKNIDRNGYTSKVVVFAGVASRTGKEYTIHTIPGLEEYSSLGDIVHSAVSRMASYEVSVEGDTLDNLVERFGLNPGFIKIDTEGAEYDVLLGAIRTIQKHRPVIISECADLFLQRQGATSRMVTDLLTSNSYSVESLSDGEILAYPKTKGK